MNGGSWPPFSVRKSCLPAPLSIRQTGRYHGDLKPYAPLAKANAEGECHAPIYVGEAT